MRPDNMEREALIQAKMDEIMQSRKAKLASNRETDYHAETVRTPSMDALYQQGYEDGEDMLIMMKLSQRRPPDDDALFRRYVDEWHKQHPKCRKPLNDTTVTTGVRPYVPPDVGNEQPEGAVAIASESTDGGHRIYTGDARLSIAANMLATRFVWSHTDLAPMTAFQRNGWARYGRIREDTIPRHLYGMRYHERLELARTVSAIRDFPIGPHAFSSPVTSPYIPHTMPLTSWRSTSSGERAFQNFGRALSSAHGTLNRPAWMD